METQFCAVALRVAQEKFIDENFVYEMFYFGKNLIAIYLQDLVKLGIIKKLDDRFFAVLKNENQVKTMLNCHFDVVCCPSDLERFACIEKNKKIYKFGCVFFSCNVDISNCDVKANSIIYAHRISAHNMEAFSIENCKNIVANRVKAQILNVCEKCICKKIDCPKIVASKIYCNNIKTQQIVCYSIKGLKNQ